MRVHGTRCYSAPRCSLINRNCFSAAEAPLLLLLPRRNCRLLLPTEFDYLLPSFFHAGRLTSCFKASLCARSSSVFCNLLNVKLLCFDCCFCNMQSFISSDGLLRVCLVGIKVLFYLHSKKRFVIFCM